MSKVVLILVISALSLTGCASYGNKVIMNETVETVSQKIVKGKTTKEEIRAMYGDPLKTEFNANGDLMWTYRFSKETHGGADFLGCLFTLGIVCNRHADEKHLVILFDAQGTVKNFDLTTSEATFSTI